MEYKKIAVISDLHADINMLKEFLSFIDKEKIELVINLGDFVSEGENPCEVVDSILGNEKFINIRGYDETRILGELDNEEKNKGLNWTKNKLGQERLKRIGGLPSIKLLVINDIRFLLMHLNGFAELSQKVAHSNNQIISGNSYDYIFCGGSHVQQFVHVKEPFFNTNIIEPGSLLNKENNRGYFTIIKIQDNIPKITFENIEYKNSYKVENNKIELNTPVYLIEDVNLKEKVCIKVGDNRAEGQEDFLRKIVDMGIKKGRYISIGCRQEETKIARELLYYLKCRRIKVCEKSKQHWYMGEITPEIKKYIEKEVAVSNGKLKWFEVSFLENLNSVEPIYTIYDYGRKYLIKKAHENDIANIE